MVRVQACRKSYVAPSPRSRQPQHGMFRTKKTFATHSAVRLLRNCIERRDAARRGARRSARAWDGAAAGDGGGGEDCGAEAWRRCDGPPRELRGGAADGCERHGDLAWSPEDEAITFNCTKMRSAKMEGFTSVMDWETLKIGPQSTMNPKDKEDIKESLSTGEDIHDAI